MGTGGPSRQSTPTIQFAASLDSFNIIPQPFENCKPFFKIFRKNFAAKAAGLGKRLFTIVLNRASADPSLSKTSGDLAHLPYTPSQPSRTDSQCFSPREASGNEHSANCPWRSHRSHRSHRGQIAGVSLRVKRVITSDPRLARRRRKKVSSTFSKVAGGAGARWAPFSARSPLPRRSVMDAAHWAASPEPAGESVMPLA